MQISPFSLLLLSLSLFSLDLISAKHEIVHVQPVDIVDILQEICPSSSGVKMSRFRLLECKLSYLNEWRAVYNFAIEQFNHLPSHLQKTRSLKALYEYLERHPPTLPVFLHEKIGDSSLSSEESEVVDVHSGFMAAQRISKLMGILGGQSSDSFIF